VNPVYQIATVPAVEPVSLIEAKTHLRVGSVSFADSTAEGQSIAPAEWAVTPLYGIEGTGVAVSGSRTLVVLNVGVCAGTLDAKIQDSDDDVTYADWTGGAFTQRTGANDETTEEIEYTGEKAYVRVVGQVAGDVCSFSALVIERTEVHPEDTYISRLITKARKKIEKRTGRALITQTWDMYMQGWPSDRDFFKIGKPPLQSVEYIKYTDCDGDVTTWSTDYYDVDIISQPGLVRLGYGDSWPSETLHPTNPINVRFTAGYGDAASDVEEDVIHAIKLLLTHWYENREPVNIGNIVTPIPFGVDDLLGDFIVWGF
jgi:uncharacterized phiE125 gp8 family phage protein